MRPLVFKSKSGTKPAFSLIELMIVVGVIGILSGVVFNVINTKTQKDKTSDAVKFNNVQNIAELVESYKYLHGSYPIHEAGGSLPDKIPDFAANWPGDDYIYKSVDGETFTISVPQSADHSKLIEYDSFNGKINVCDEDDCLSANLNAPEEPTDPPVDPPSPPPPPATIDLRADAILFDDTTKQYYARYCRTGTATPSVSSITLKIKGVNSMKTVNLTNQPIPASGCIESSKVSCTSLNFFSSSYCDYTEGGHAIEIVVDSSNILSEGDETNNKLVANVVVGSAPPPPSSNPDLYVNTIGWDSLRKSYYANFCLKSGPSLPTTTRINLTIKASASGKSVTIYGQTAPLPGSCRSTTKVSCSTFNASTSGTGDYCTFGKNYQFTTKVDSSNAITESDETNNTLTKTVYTSGDGNSDM
jgi:prepilin-type N-terminal cleavage/methylation domain-containing protein